MNLIKLSIERPIAVLSVVFMIVLMGWVALNAIPIQLTPDVRKPVLSISTSWSGASAIEVEQEIVNRQEDALKGLEGLEKMEARARAGRGRIILEFAIGANMDRAMLLINNRLSQINNMPADAREPRIRTRDSDDNPIAWFIVQTTPENKREVLTYGAFVEDVVQDRLERVEGIALANVWGGDRRELRIIVEPTKMARYGLTIPAVVDALRRNSVNISAGDLDEGKRKYVVRTEGELNSVERIRQVSLHTGIDKVSGRISRVTVGDIASVEVGYKRRSSQVRSMGEKGIVMNLIRETGANVIETVESVDRVVKELNAGLLKQEGLRMTKTYDDTFYINSAIELVTSNIWFGGTLAILILLLFLRSPRAVIIIGLAIPVSIIGAIVAMAGLGRSINVISLAGIAFAVGMVVDAAIVVLENIYRLRQTGMSRVDATYHGAKQVWGAVLVSAMTTVAVFTPILIMESTVGQLFRDIAVALSVSVTLSLIVAITVIPSLANKLLGRKSKDRKERIHIPVIDDFAKGFMKVVLGITRTAVNRRVVALSIITVICGTTAVCTWLFLPKLEYLPDGNKNLIRARIQPPPGYNLATMTQIAEEVEAKLRPHWAKPGDEDSKPGEIPKMSRFWFIARSTSNFVSVAALDPKRAEELIPVLRRTVLNEPGTFGFVSQSSLFGRGFGGSRVIELEITGPDLEALMATGREVVRRVGQVMPRSEGTQVRPRPGLELGAPEIRVIPDLQKLGDNGLSSRDLGQAIDTFNDGLKAGEVTLNGKRVDLTLMGPENRINRTQGIDNLPVITKAGIILPASALSRIEVTEGPNEIYHLEKDRTINIQVRPRSRIPLETAIETLQNGVVEPMLAAGMPPGVKLTLSGSATELNKTWDAMVWNLLIALIIVYLVMAILFEDFLYPMLIMFSVPLATAGGVAGLVILNQFTFTPLDMLTLLGFVILIGTVVNNAILLVHQTLFHLREEGYQVADAIVESTRNRVRPIFMSTLTSIGGMMPLVAMPGAGSELYRGLGAVVVGGLALSAVLTLLIIPSLMSLIGPILQRERMPARPRVIEAQAAAE